jgi:MFS family permease
MHRPSPFLVRLFLASFCWSAAIGVFNPFAGVYFGHYLAFALGRLGVFFSVAQIVQAIAVLLITPRLIRHLGVTAGILTTQLLSGATLGMLAIGHGALWAEMFFCAFMIAQHMSASGLQILLMNQIPEVERSQAAAMNYLVMAVAQAVAAAVAGTALARFSYPPVLTCAALAILVSSLLLRVLCTVSQPASPPTTVGQTP